VKLSPNCGKKEGKLAVRKPARFPYAVICGACGFTTDWVRLPGVAEKLWNEARLPTYDLRINMPLHAKGAWKSWGDWLGTRRKSAGATQVNH